MRVAVVLVHYHTPDLAVAAYEALEQDLRGSGLEAEWVLIDNGSRPPEREKLGALPVHLVDPGKNLGYAGGANLGVRSTEAEYVVLMNPDVLVRPGCVGALCTALEQGASAAGPRFFWDRERGFLLPPTERRTRLDEILGVLAEHREVFARLGRRRWRRHARHSWTAREPYVCYELSGALLAFTRQAWETLGGFDEGYRLYFEETDWLERLRRRHLEARFVPAAEAIHLYAQSSVGEPRANAWFAESQARFRRRFYGASFTACLERLGRLQPTSRAAAASGRGAPAWLEVSSSAAGYPAAARPWDGAVPSSPSLPEEVLERLPHGTYHLRWVDARGREVGYERLEHH